MSRPPGLPTSRRAALGGLLAGGVSLTGCDPGPSGTGSPTSPGATPGADPDAALVSTVRRELEGLAALLAAVAAARPGLADRFRDLAALHRAHLGVLPDGDPVTHGSRLPGDPEEIERLVARRESLAQRRLADWSVSAQSGALARLLAGMSAAIAQQLAATPLGSAR